MLVLLGIALKSLLIAGTTLALLQLMKRRSAAERSWVAHIGLLALVLLAVAPLVLPTLPVEAPALLGRAPAIQAPVETASPSLVKLGPGLAGKIAPLTTQKPPLAVAPAAAQSKPAIGAVAATIAIYAIPAAILLFITFLALARLVALRARAEVLVDGHWLSALARAQRRMGFKHGTALLTSNELASPISWGLMRPVILLNNRAVEASGEAEAIIAHELAHVARMDWVKLLLARVASALFWFNPFVWLLAREAHQLREEAADDAVLAADIPDTDYAQLLVGVARHECPGLLLGAHGVAPSRSSLARRVARVLDGASVRGPVARSFAAGVFVGAVAIAAPLAALTLTPHGTSANTKLVATNNKQGTAPASGSAYYPAEPVPADLPSIIGEGVATSVHGAMTAIDSGGSEDFRTTSPNGASVISSAGVMVARAPSGATVTVYPPDKQGRRKVVARAPNGATTVTYADADDDITGAIAAPFHRTDNAIQNAIAMKTVGVTQEYVTAMRASAPELRDADADDLIGMKAVGVTPAFVRDLSAAGIRNFDAGDLAGARAVGVDSGYIRDMRAAGFGDADLGDLTGARAVGITGDYVRRMRLAGYDGDLDDFIALHTVKDGRRPRPTLPPLPPAPPPAPHR
jgi:beta-lactamase regulating signal transducer with metallopeptidase domain